MFAPSKVHRRLSPDVRVLAAIAAVVVVANGIYLLGVSDPNPLGPRSGLSVSAPVRLPGQPTIDPNSGFVSQALSHRAALDLVHLRLPWWDPYQGTGAPLAGEMQSAALFPPTLLTLLSNGQLYERILLEFLAGAATYLLLRRLRLSRWASGAGGAAFALNGTFAWFSHAPINPVAFLPLLLVGIELAFARAEDGRAGGYWLIGVTGALSFLAGFPETTYLDGLLAVLWFAWRLGCTAPARRPALVGKGLAGLAIAALLAGPLIVAGLEYTAHGDLGAHNSNALGSVHLGGLALPMMLMPYIYGPIFAFSDPHGTLINIWARTGGYLTTALALMGVIGLLSRGRAGLRAVLGGWVLLVIARSYGEIPLLGHVLGWLPEMARVQFFRFSAPGLELAVVILAAIGLDDLARRAWRRRGLLALALGSVAVLIASTLGALSLSRQLGSAHHRALYLAASVLWGTATVAVLLAVAWWRPRRTPTLLTAVLVGNALVMFAAPELSAPASVSVDTRPVAYLERHLGQGRFFTLGPLAPNYGAYYGLSSLNINDLPVPSNFARFVHRRLDPYVHPTALVGNQTGGRSPLAPSPSRELASNLPNYRAAGVDYVLTPTNQPLDLAGATLVRRTPSSLIYSLSGAAPLMSAHGCRLSDTSLSATTVTCPRPATLVRRETFLPGWSATIGGRSVPVRASDGLFESVSLPAGRHQVRFAFSPPYVIWAWVGFAAGVLWLVVTAARAVLRSRRHERGEMQLGPVRT